MTCNHCGATVTSGLVLCEMCQRRVAIVLEYLPVYYRNLARWQLPNRPNGSVASPGSWMLRQGDASGPDRIIHAIDDTLDQLLIWANLLVDARPYLARLLDRLSAARAAKTIDDSQTVAWLCAGFLRHLTSVATLDWSGEFVRKLDHLYQRLQRMSAVSLPGWYAGACRHCGLPTYVVPGMTWVKCKTIVLQGVDDNDRPIYEDIGCGATTHAGDHLDVILNEARDWVARPKEICGALVALLPTEPSVAKLYERIKKWRQRERIEPIDRLGYNSDLDYAGERYSPKRYRLGDVLDLLRVEGDTQTGTDRKGQERNGIG